MSQNGLVMKIRSECLPGHLKDLLIEIVESASEAGGCSCEVCVMFAQR